MKKIEALATQVGRVMKAVNKVMIANDKPKLTLRDLLTLGVVHSDGVEGPAKLAELRGVSSAAITGAIDRLERKGLVLREHAHHDRRVTPIKLTGLAMAVIDATEESL